MTETSTLSLGEIVTWTPPTVVEFSLLKEAVAHAGLDSKLLTEMLPRHAFARAANRLEENRIVRKVDEDSTLIRFQLTSEFLDSENHELHYHREATVSVQKKTGIVESDVSEVAARIQSLLDAELKVRKSADVTRLIQRIFDKHSGDLVSIRDAGGAYFVPSNQEEIVVRVSDFLVKIDGKLRRFKIGAADESTSGSIADSMTDHFHKLISDFRGTLEIVTPDSSESVLRRRRDRIQELRFKLSTFRDMLQENADGIHSALNEAEQEFGNRRTGESLRVHQPEVAEDESQVESEPVEELALSF
ncbi:hypothetical protein KOR42_23170 [Thalassoglobus neptunius]|uniref:Uncharacterized protein n=1 Tax=Thalassoglobus neptunius TaxID=1938619 RepID=A0A5C5X7K2_9PLAN|nr:DUF6744 family protein [Thalassoglobus neptunius]TWT58930.1 hypothetical protein KOR42_23170 [Thalassoglobus neptunius]